MKPAPIPRRHNVARLKDTEKTCSFGDRFEVSDRKWSIASTRDLSRKGFQLEQEFLKRAAEQLELNPRARKISRPCALFDFLCGLHHSDRTQICR